MQVEIINIYLESYNTHSNFISITSKKNSTEVRDREENVYIYVYRQINIYFQQHQKDQLLEL